MEKIELRKARNFGQLFNDSIQFLKLNFKSYFGALLFLAGPFIILTALLSGYLQVIQNKLVSSNMMAVFGSGPWGLFSSNFFGTTFMFILIYLLTTLVTNATIALYFKQYDKSTGNELPLSYRIFSPSLAATCWRLFYNLLVFVIIIAVVAVALVGIFALLFMIPFLNILVGIATVFAYLMLIPILFYLLNVANFIVVRDEILITEALSKAIRYMRGNFWWTWLLMLCVGLSLVTIYSLFSLPIVILNISKAFLRYGQQEVSSGNSVLFFVFGALSIVGQLLVISPVFSTFCIFNFYSQEEMKEGTSLLKRIDDINAD